MSNVTNRIFVDKMGGRAAVDYVGVPGEIFYDPNTGVLRLSDGVTPGGKSIVESSPLESEYIGDWVYFVRPDDQPEVMDEIAPNLILARAEGGLLYNAYDQEDGYELNNPSGTSWNTDGWADLSTTKDRYYQDLYPSLSGGGWAILKHEWIMHDTNNDKYYAIRFLTWDSGSNYATGAFSYIRREINTSIYFSRADTNDETEALTGGDVISEDLVITRGQGGAIFNYAASETYYDDDQSPVGTLWNAEGYADLSNLASRQFVLFDDLFAGQNLGRRIVGKELVMHDTVADKYYAVKFTRWQQGNYFNYPGFSYVRRLIDTTKLTAGLKFNDGTVQTTAYNEKAAGTIKESTKLTSLVGDRYLTSDDIGKMLVFGYDVPGTSIRIPDAGAVDFPIGATITIVNRTGGNLYLYKENDDENGAIYGAGTADNNTAWTIPDAGGGNICTLIKIATGMDNYTNDWMLVGSNIVSGD